MKSIKKEYTKVTEYYNEQGELHREDGPAVEWNDGDKSWYINGKLHRTDGPAIERTKLNKQWFINGQRHREDGPAVEYFDGGKDWFLNGINYYSEDKWKQEVTILKLKRILDL